MMTEEQAATLIGRIVMGNESQRIAMAARINELETQVSDLLSNQVDTASPNGKTEKAVEVITGQEVKRGR